MRLYGIKGEERLEKIKRSQYASIEMAEEWAKILEFYIDISEEISLADVYQTYKRINVKMKNEITDEETECLELMKRSIYILLDVWEYKDHLLRVINEVNERFEPMIHNCNHIITEIFCNTSYKIINHKIDMMILLFESDLKFEYRGSLQKELSDVYKQTVNTLINIIDVKDSYTRGHLERVSIIAERFGNTLKLSKEKLEELIIASKLHDVGKIGVAESILTKKGGLSSDEYEKVKKHTEYGESIVKGIFGFENIANIIKYHHERYDGKGYYSLTSDLIPENVYIICLCDAFDTMNSNRSYRISLSFETIIEEYQKCSGTQFEPVLCQKFIKFLQNNAEDIQKIYRH
jgi:HD-GYP domain-containing protein (c-di-GMP phosphodiesterase class II)